jgi:hypothetical protein
VSTLFSRSTDASTVTPDLVLPFDGEDDPGTIVHRVLGTERVDVNLRPAQAGTGTMRLFFLTYADAAAARLFFRAPAIFITASDLAWLPVAFVPVAPMRRVQQDVNVARWVLEVPYQEVTT